jgi:hypothetical protein
MQTAQRIFPVVCLGGVLTACSVCAQTLTIGLVGYWNFDEGAGSTLNDHSGFGNNGTLLNANGGGAWTTGHFGGAYYFPGVTGGNSTRFEIPNAASLQMTTGITVAAWVRVDNNNSDAPILAKEGPNVGDLSYWFGPYFSGHFGMLLDNNGVQGWDADHRNEGSVPGSTWVHLAATWDGTTMINYIDGTAVSSGLTFTSTINVSPQLLAIGVNSGYNNTAFTGAIDDLYLYNRALSGSEIGQLMASPIPEPAATTAVIGALAWTVAAVVRRRRARTS